MTLPAALPAGRRAVWGWCLYDFANSPFTTIIVTVAFSVYFREVIAGGGEWADFLWGAAISGSMVVLAVLAPLLGAMADAASAKKRFLRFFTLLCGLSTIALVTVGPGTVILAFVLFTIANVAFEASCQFYDALLPAVAPADRLGRTSAFGWALGYTGGLLGLAASLPFVLAGERSPLFPLAFALSGVWLLGFSIPTFAWVPEPAGGAPGTGLSWARAAAQGVLRVVRTAREIRRYRDLFLFVAAYLVFNDGVKTVISFSSIYATRTLGMSMFEVFVFFIATNVAGVIGTLLSGAPTDQAGPLAVVRVSLVVWILVAAGAYFSQGALSFTLVGLLAGLVLGPVQSASRALVGRLSPADKTGEFYGFLAVGGRLAAVAGPLLFGLLSALTGEQRTAVLSVAAFFAAGLFLLRYVDLDRGLAAAGRNPAR